MTRSIHLRGEAVEMTMTGAETEGLAFTVAQVRSLEFDPASRVAGRLRDMQEQMARNIASAGNAVALSPARVAIIDRDGKARGWRQSQAMDAHGGGPHRGIRLQGRFFVVGGAPAQAVVIGRQFDPDAARQFFESLRIVDA